MLQLSNSIKFDWYLHFHTYICDLIVLTISLHLKAQIIFMLSDRQKASTKIREGSVG